MLWWHIILFPLLLVVVMGLLLHNYPHVKVAAVDVIVSIRGIPPRPQYRRGNECRRIIYITITEPYVL